MKLTRDGNSRKVFYGWWIVLVAAIGLAVGYGPVIVYTFSVFFKPVSDEFNWSRAETSLAFSLSLTVMVIAMPLIGRLVDRFGARKVILPSATIFALSLASFYILPLGRLQFYVVFLVIGLVGAGTTPVPYNSVLSHWFDKRRGLALGLATIGIGLSSLAMPVVASGLIEKLGWRAAYLLMAVAVMAVTFPVVGLFLKESPQMIGLTRDGEEVYPTVAGNSPTALEGLSFREAWRSSTFWLMAVAFFLISASINGCLIHLVPMLKDRNVSNQTAVLAASLLGGATFVGRAGTGYLLDRFFASYVAVCFFAGAALGILFLLYGTAVLVAIAAAVLVGLGNGAEADIMAYQLGRYFGLRAFAEIYSYILASYTLGGVVGPLVMGLSFDLTHSYRPILVLFLVAVSVSAGLMLLLGPYRRWEPAESLPA